MGRLLFVDSFCPTLKQKIRVFVLLPLFSAFLLAVWTGTTTATDMSRHSLRLYQEECLEQAKKKNIIASLPSASGKTLIAARLIEHCLEQNPKKRAAFLVPNRSIVEQQSKECEEQCLVKSSRPIVQRLVGDEQAGWQQAEWDEAMHRSHILLGTPQVLLDALVTNKYIRVDDFCLFVFDECHNATGNHPMASILRDGISRFVATADSTLAPRILGLTASIIDGSMKNIQKKRRYLETLMNSTIICPDLPTKLHHFHHITYEQDPNLETHKAQIDRYVTDALHNIRLIKDVKKLALRCSHVFCELGKTSMDFYIDTVIVQQIEARATHLELQKDEHANAAALKLRKCLPSLREDLSVVSESLSSALSTHTLMAQSPKLLRLLQLLDENFSSKGSDGYRGIVFVEQVALCSALAKQINDRFGSRFRCGAVAGAKAQKEEDERKQLENFRHGHVHILVSTRVLEEGLDVPDCQFVVRFNKFPTTKGHIQGAGRARHADAEIYYFDNCPLDERRKEAAMTAEARSDSQLSEDDLHNAFLKLRISIDGRHPYPFGSSDESEGEVNVFNSRNILNSYCSLVLGQSISPAAELYEYLETTPVDGIKKLSSIRYPAPDGWRLKTSSDCKEWWSGVDWGELFGERAKNRTQSEKEEMCFVYLVVVELREKGLLDKHNKPNEEAAFESKRNCPLRHEGPPSGFGLKDSVVQSFGRMDLESDGWVQLPPSQESTVEDVNERSVMSRLDSTFDDAKESSEIELLATPTAAGAILSPDMAKEQDVEAHVEDFDDSRFEDATELPVSPLQMEVDVMSTTSPDPSQLTFGTSRR